MSEVSLIAVHHIIRSPKAGGEVLPGHSFKETADEAELLIAAGAARRAVVAEESAAPAAAPAKPAKGKKPAAAAEPDLGEGEDL